MAKDGSRIASASRSVGTAMRPTLKAETAGAALSRLSACRHSARPWRRPGMTSTMNAPPRSRMELIKYNNRTSMKSASPAAAMPIRNSVSRETKKTLLTRPRISRGVLRWITRRRAMEAGALQKPDTATIRIARGIEWVNE